MNSFQVKAILSGRRSFAVGVFLMILVAIFSSAALLPATYTASGAVYIDTKFAVVDPISGAVVPASVAGAALNSEVELLGSQRVILRAVQRLGVDKSPVLRDLWRAETDGVGDFNSWMVDKLGRKLDIRSGKDSSIVSIAYSATDREFAAAMVNSIIAAFIETKVDMKTEPARQYGAYFDRRTQELQEALDKAQAKKLAFETKNGILPTDERLDLENMKLSELTNQLYSIQAQVAESSSRQRLSEARAERMPESLASATVSALTADIARQEARLEELTQKYGESYPQVVEQRASLAKLRAKAEAEVRKVGAGISAVNDVNQYRLQQARLAVEEQRQRIISMKAKRDEALLISNEIESTRKALEALSGRLNQTDLESKNTQTNVSVVKNAAPPSLPSFPRWSVMIAVGLIAAAVGSVGATIMLEFWRPKIRTEADVLQAAALPMLVRIPVVKSTMDQSRLSTAALKLGVGHKLQRIEHTDSR